MTTTERNSSSDSTFSRRLPLFAALGVLVLYGGASATLTIPPSATAPPLEIAGYFADHQAALHRYVWSLTLGLAALGLTVALVRETLPRRHAAVFTVGGISLLGQAAVSTWITGALSLGSMDAGAGAVVFRVGAYFGPVVTSATLLMVGAIAFLPAIPRWLRVFSVLVLAEQLVETVTVFGRDGFLEPGGTMNQQLGGPLFVLWLVAVAAWCSRGPARARAKVPLEHTKAAALALVSALALGACGGGEAATTPAADRLDSAFIAKVEAACQTAVDAMDAQGPFPVKGFDAEHPDAAQLPEVATYFAPFAAIRRQLERDLDAVGEPATGARRWAALHAEAIAAEENALQQIAAAKRGDAAAFTATVKEAHRLLDRISDIDAPAAGFGADSPCGRAI